MELTLFLGASGRHGVRSLDFRGTPTPGARGCSKSLLSTYSPTHSLPSSHLVGNAQPPIPSRGVGLADFRALHF